MEGVVVKSTGSWYQVRDPQGNMHACRLKGKFKIKGLKVTNPIAVGDRVKVENEATDQSCVITEILPRENYLIRTSLKHPEIGHILASNLDQAVLMATMKQPRTSLGFIDRYLVSAETFRIPVVIIFNKIDLLDSNELREVDDLISLYQGIGYPSLATSFLKPQGLDSLEELLAGKTSLLSGHSGVGKSTLLNFVAPGYQQKTSEVSESIQKGVHTTTFAEMFEIGPDSFIIDTPGIKELGLMEVGEEELSHYFPEMRSLLGQCKFHNCRHVHEPKCAVLDAIGISIAESRYLSYLSMLENEDNRR
ncbi:MAG: ribosome small subunit-dependent GTPase A [Cyclobacteriaceae bacterium]|nr:ribosome small subunit-dependent GTPase A [Cyclobacteriaceae bacterium]